MKTSVSDYLFSPLVWIQIFILFILLTLLALVITPLGPLLGAWAGNSFVKGLTIDGVSGSLLTSLKIEKIVWDNGGSTTVEGIDLEVGTPDFSKNLAVIDSLTIDAITIDLDENATPRKRGELVNIGDFGTAPANLMVAEGQLDAFIITKGESTVFALNNLRLDGTRAQENQLILKDIQGSMVIPNQPVMGVSIADMTMDMLAPHAFSLNSNFLWQHPQFGELALNAKGDGLLQKYSLSATGDITHPELGNQKLSLQGAGDFDFIDIERLSLHGEDGVMQATGELAWVPSLSTDLSIDADNLQTAQFAPEWPAELNGKFKLKGQLEQDQLRGELDIASLAGSLRGFPVSGSGKVSMLNQELIFDKLNLRSADNTIKVDGRGSEPFDLSWDVNGRDISTLLPGLTGRVKAKGTLSGNLETPILNGVMSGTRLSFQGNKADSAALEIKTDAGQFLLSGEARGVLVGGERFSSIKVRGNGDLDKHSIALSTDHSEAKVAASLVGGWDAGVWQSKLENLSVDNPAFGRWRLDKPANISVSASGVSADELCMASTSGSACTAINYSPQTGFETSGKLVNAPLDLLNPFLPAEFAIKGRVAGDYQFSLNPDLKGNADLNFAEGEVKLTQDGKIQRFAYRQGKVKADIDGNNIKSDIDFELAGQGALVANTDIQLSPDDGKHVINAKGQFKEIPLGLAQTFLPEGISVSGLASGLFDLQQVDDSRKGQLSLTSNDLRFARVDPATGRQQYEFDNVDIDATIENDKVTAVADLSIRGGGSLKTRANADLSQSDLMKSIEAEGQVRDMPMALARPYLPETIGIDGLLSGDYKISQQSGVPVGEVDLVANNGLFGYQNDKGERQIYRYDTAKIKGTIQGDDVLADVDLILKDGGRLSTRARLDLASENLIKSVEAEGRVEALSLDLISPYLPPEISVDGLLTGDYKVSQQSGEPVGQIDLQANKGVFAYKPAAGERQTYRYDSLKVNGSIQGEKVVANVDLALQGGGLFTTRANVDLANKDLIKSIEADGQVKDLPLALARPYLPKEIDVDGFISGQYQVRQEGNGPVGQVDLLAKNGFFSYAKTAGKPELYRYSLAKLQGGIKGDQATADVALELTSGGALTSKVSAVVSSFDKKPIFNAEGTLEALPLELVQAYLPKALEIAGRASGRYQVEQNGQLKGKVELSVPDSFVRYDDGKSEAQQHRFSRADIAADIDGDNVDTDLNFVLQDGGAFSMRGRLDLAQSKNLYGFEGEGTLEAFPLALLQPYLPSKMVLKGAVGGRYQLTQRGGQQGSVQLKFPEGGLTFIDEKGESQSYDYKSGEVNAVIRGKQVTGDAVVVMSDGGVVSTNGSIVLGNSAKTHTVNLQGNLKEFPIGIFKPYLPNDLDFPGKVSGAYVLKQQGGKLSGDLGLSLPNSYFTVQTASGDKQSFAYQNGIVNAKIDGNRINLESSLDFRGRGDFRGRAQILLRDKGSPSINGEAEINIPNIYWAQSYVPYSRGLRGTIVGNVKFSGLVSKPSVTGQLSMSDGYLRLPQVGTELSNISLQIQANQANQATISGTMHSGGGVISANGSLSLNDVKNWSAKMSLRGDNIKFVDTHEAAAYMTPNLQINASPQAIVITGTVDIPKADINLQDLPEFSIDESDDVVVIGEGEPGGVITAVRMQPNVLVRLGNEVYFNGFGFSTRLVGGVRVTNSRNTIVTNGSLNIVNGRYQAYGQDLRIANGRLVFNGLPKNVGVDVQAVRPVEDIGTVGIHLTGTMQKLKSTIFSDPIMQETDALSYLLTGQSLTSATGRETALLMQAVRGLGIDGSNGLIQRIGKSLGLDDLSIVTREDFKDSELQLGKRLGSKLYVRYLVGLFDSAHRLAVEYRVNKYLNFEVQAGVDEQSIDLIYEYEKE